MKEEENLLEIKNLKIRFYHNEGIVKAVNGVDINVHSSEAVGIVGESGCGKSVTALSTLRILPPAGKITEGKINYRNEKGDVKNVVAMDSRGKEVRKLRGNEISMIFQEPMTAFSPVHTIGNQICESILEHNQTTQADAENRAIELLDLVGISNPSQRIEEYPFQLSGGMRQRAMIAMALACGPRLLIADEPTTALDVTIQAQVLKLIQRMQEDLNLSLILITHDLGVIAKMVERVYVMYLGYIVESAQVIDTFRNPKHPYTKDLLESIPTITGVEGELASIKGSIPDSYTLPSGCPFHPRCSKKIGKICEKEMPVTKEVDSNHMVRCHLYLKNEVKANA